MVKKIHEDLTKFAAGKYPYST